jgi:hypothetical protein
MGVKVLGSGCEVQGWRGDKVERLGVADVLWVCVLFAGLVLGWC